MGLVFPSAPQPCVSTSCGDLFPVRRIFCVGRNYAAHAREMGQNPDREQPFFFTKWAETVVPTGSEIAYPPETENFHYEAELVVAIGKAGRCIPPSEALDHIFGYATGLDMTRRDLQFNARDKGRPWDVGKNFEQSSPIGLIHPIADVGEITHGSIHLTLNGAIKQHADISELIWPVNDVIAYISRFYGIQAGDLIYTGTPAGVGPVVPGDKLVVAIAGLSDCHTHIGNRLSDKGN